MKFSSNNRGQSTVEFLFSFIFVVLVVFLFIRVTMNYTSGFLVHYATYMASRSYLVFDDNSVDPASTDQNAVQVSKAVFDSYRTDLFLNIADGPTFSINHPTDVYYLFVGAIAEYKQKFGSGMIGTGDILSFKSESFLGREPSKQECAIQVCEAISAVVGNCSDENLTLYDNGC